MCLKNVPPELAVSSSSLFTGETLSFRANAPFDGNDARFAFIPLCFQPFCFHVHPEREFFRCVTAAAEGEPQIANDPGQISASYSKITALTNSPHALTVHTQSFKILSKACTIIN